MESAEWLVAEEHDEKAFERLGEALLAMGGSLERSHWALGGSQEISTWHIIYPDGALAVTAETYCGLRVSGPKELVVRAQELYRGTAAR